ncbi:(2Fe-2S)-binding protein [Cognataquiflexum rubidum]|uniref:(2Fe-2S)-binding protein n=1 Tax=Cognataquiflexum rubidum TaxID=2922273 RepID=UPI001F13A600|nr:(2Fe-2S)-binding protein [Cognataquiflexum rubidum]MCH6235012.1 (2Fe-2S)-binding protein [Cognataquiflexum rubidum]
MQYAFILNGKPVQVTAEEDANLLWTLRERLKLTGTKFGCGVSLCGSCIVHIDGKPVKSCITPLSQAVGKKVTTIEGLSDDKSHPLQVAWIEEQVPQCGYCQSGQIMQAAALLAENPNPNREEIIKHMNGVLCRCGTYLRILKAIEKTAQKV